MKKLFNIRYSDYGISYATLILRVAAGVMMMNHGLDKLLKFSEMSPAFSDPFHIGSTVSLALVVFAEFFCAALVALGLFTRLACIPLIITMSVALFSSHNGNIFGKGESSAIYLAVFVALLLTGPGRVSVDKFAGK